MGASSYLVSNKAVRSGLGLEVPYHETRIHGPSGCALGAGGGWAGSMIVNAYVCAHSHMHHFNMGLT